MLERALSAVSPPLLPPSIKSCRTQAMASTILVHILRYYISSQSFLTQKYLLEPPQMCSGSNLDNQKYFKAINSLRFFIWILLVYEFIYAHRLHASTVIHTHKRAHTSAHGYQPGYTHERVPTDSTCIHTFIHTCLCVYTHAYNTYTYISNPFLHTTKQMGPRFRLHMCIQTRTVNQHIHTRLKTQRLV